MNYILVDVNPVMTRVALVENDELAEFYIEKKGHERIVGNIYKGKVSNVLPGMQAAFVDIGLEKNAFLYAGDILVDKSDFAFNGQANELEENLKKLSIRKLLKPGQEITVQILKEPIGNKGARVTTHLTLPSRNVVLMPTVDYIGVSRRIEDENERCHLMEIARKIKPEGMGIIMRTASEGKDINELQNDIRFLNNLWENINKKDNMSSAPSIIHKDENLIYRTVRDMFTDKIDRFIINDKKQYKNTLEFAEMIDPSLKSRIELYEDNYDLYDCFQIESKVEKIFGRKVWLKSGGYLVIDPTEALTSIDVNTGKYVGGINLQDTVYNTNIEAAQEIARQVRLRDIGGIIIIDFIDMDDPSHKEKVIQCLKQELKRDRTKTNVLGITSLGLVEMTRKKARQRLSSVVQKQCSYCHGTGRIYSESIMIMKAIKEVNRIFVHTNDESVILEMHPELVKEINVYDCFSPIEKTFNKKIYVHLNGGIHIEQIKIHEIVPNTDMKKLLDSLHINIDTLKDIGNFKSNDNA